MQEVHGGARLRSTAAAPGRFIATITNKGWANPVVPQIGRLYAAESSLPNKGWCSGTLIRRGLVLTAGHCVYANGVDRAPDGSSYHYYDYTRMTFVPGNRLNPANTITGLTDYGNWSIKNMWAVTAWQQNDQSKDWALIELNPDANGRYPGDTTGTLQVYYGLTLTRGQNMQAIGYPTSQLFGTAAFFTGNGQYFVSSTINFGQNCDAVACGSFFVNYDSVMTGGSSGGPIFYQGADGVWRLSGVVNRGLTTCLCQNPPQNDYGKFRLTGYMDESFNAFLADVIDQINRGG